MTAELSLLFQGMTFDPSELDGVDMGISVDQMIKTDHYCPECMSLDKCRMLAPGWQTLFSADVTEYYRVRGRGPQFRMRQCKFLDGQEKKTIGLFTPRALNIYSFKTYQPTIETQALYDTCFNYARDFSEFTTKGLLIMGSNGAGKTHLAVSIAKTLARKGIDVGLMDVEQWLNKIRESYDDDKVDPETAEMVSKRLLVIDDLVPEQKVSEWVKSQVLVVLNHRYNQLMPTIITTDKPMGMIEHVYGQRISSRLYEMCDVVMVAAKDWRQKKKPEQKKIEKMTGDDWRKGSR